MYSVRNLFSLFFGCLVLFFITACGKKQSPPHNGLGHTKHFDIPVPLSFQQSSSFAQQHDSRQADMIEYKGALSVSQTVLFYTREMERAGWEINDLSTIHEGFICCNKPTKYCGLSIRANRSGNKETATTICLFVCNRS